MTGEAHWFVPLMVILGGVGLFLIGYLSARATNTLRWFRREVRCPPRGATVTCTLVRDLRSGRWTSVQSCSAFANPRDVDCRMECLDALNRAGDVEAAN